MDKNKMDVIKKSMVRTADALRKNNMECFIAETKEEVLPIVESLLKINDLVACGGSQTLKECGIIELLKTGSYKYLNRETVPEKDMQKLYRASFSADAYLCSSNAITEKGELYNVDGNSNRVACICYGPSSVIIIAGYNKIVKNLDEAVKRVKSISAPANTNRLTCASYCYETGQCVSLTRNGNMTDGCDCDGRICCNYVVSARQRHKDRIKVILVGEELGY